VLLSIRRKIVCVSAKKNKVYWHKVKGYNRFTALPIYDANSTRLYQVLMVKVKTQTLGTHKSIGVSTRSNNYIHGNK